MARLALKLSQQKRLAEYMRAKQAGKKPEYPTRIYNRCKLCGRRHGYMRFFGICRICFRELATNGDLPGVTKSSW
jgi:small subunit ribosomal protein S14